MASSEPSPGPLNAAFTHYDATGEDPKHGAEVIVRLMADEKNAYEDGTQWEFEEGEMRIVPWYRPSAHLGERSPSICGQYIRNIFWLEV